MFNDLKSLFQKIKTWFENDIPNKRLQNDQNGRKWFLKSIGYSEELKLKQLREITNRDSLNGEYESRYEEKDVKAGKGISALKIEISALYGFNKCFVQRWKGRMHFYRDDLSQKGARNMCSLGQSFGLFEEFKKNLDS